MSPRKRDRDQFETDADSDTDDAGLSPATSLSLPADNLEYIFDQVDPNLLLAAARFRREQWPDTVFESLNWLTEMCKFATSYHAAYALMEVGTMSSIIENYFRFKARENTSQSALLLLLCNLCFRVKESHYTARKLVNFYAMLFARITRQNLSQGCLTGLNTEYEFNKQQLEALTPLFYAAFIHPVLDYKVKADREHYKECGFLPVSLDLDNISIETLLQYRAHIETTVPRVKAVWRGIATDTHEIEPQIGMLEGVLARELGYQPTLSSFAINTITAVFCAPEILRPVTFVTRKSLLAFAVEQLDSKSTPQVYRLLEHFHVLDQLAEDQQKAVLPELWALVSRFIEALLSQQGVSTALQQEAKFKLGFLKLLEERGTVADSVANSLLSFVHSDEAMNINSPNIRNVWQILADECPDLLEGLDVPLYVQQFLKRARFDDFPRRFPSAKPETKAAKAGTN